MNLYFQNLINLKDSKKFSDREIERLDYWLVSMPDRATHRLNPIQFSIDCEVRQETAIEMFYDLCELNMLKERFEVVSNDGVSYSKYFENESEIPKIIYSQLFHEPGFQMVEKKNINIFFKLIAIPDSQPEYYSRTPRKKVQAPPLNASEFNSGKRFLRFEEEPNE